MFPVSVRRKNYCDDSHCVLWKLVQYQNLTASSASPKKSVLWMWKMDNSAENLPASSESPKKSPGIGRIGAGGNVDDGLCIDTG
jgi:hypothetical protein